jgi:hypothetical protein
MDSDRSIIAVSFKNQNQSDGKEVAGLIKLQIKGVLQTLPSWPVGIGSEHHGVLQQFNARTNDGGR